jgi:hypothetical protein
MLYAPPISRQVFEFKGLRCKVFRNKDLDCQRALKMALEQLSRAVLVDGYTSERPNHGTWSHWLGGCL